MNSVRPNPPRVTPKRSFSGRRLFIFAILGLGLAYLFKSKKSKYHISNFENLGQIRKVFESQQVVSQACSYLRKSIFHQINTEGRSNSKVDLARLFLIYRCLKIDNSLSIENIKKQGFTRFICSATKASKDSIDKGPRPASSAMFVGLKYIQGKNGDLGNLAQPIEYIGPNHRHLPIIAANNLSAKLSLPLKTDVDKNYACFLFALLFMISALETAYMCWNPYQCAIDQGQIALTELSAWPKKNDRSAYGAYQMTEDTFKRMSDLAKKRTSSPLKISSSEDQIVAAAMLIHENLSKYCEDNSCSLYNFVGQCVSEDTNTTLKNLSNFIAVIDHPIWAALNTEKAKESLNYLSTSTTYRGSLYLRGLTIAKQQFAGDQ